MELNNEFTVPVPVEEAWGVLTDLERVAPCMPGAALEEVEGDEYRGVVKVKVGPVTAQYRGKASFLERDTVSHRAVLKAEGRETRGQGNASATITANLEPSGEGTRVTVVTDLSITGRVAQMGRGVLADVSNKLLGQFVQSLESTVLAGAGARAAGAGAPGEPEPAATTPGAAASTRRSRTAKKPPAESVTAPETGEAAEPATPGGPRGSRRRPSAGVMPEAPGEAAAGGVTEPGAQPEGPSSDGELSEDSTGALAQLAKGNGSEAGVRRIASDREVAPVDLLDLAGPSLAVRVLVPIALVVVVLALLRRRRRRPR